MPGQGCGNRLSGVRGRPRSRTPLATGWSLLLVLGIVSGAPGDEAPPRPGGDDRSAAVPSDPADESPLPEPPPPTTSLSGAVYLLCALTSCICAVLLLRSYKQNRVRLLFWSGLCFVGLAVDNVMLYVDLVIVPDVNIAIWRRLPGLVAMALLLFGLVWDSK